MMTAIPEKLYFKIGEVSKITNIKSYVLRYWESEFDFVNPQKTATNQRIYTKKDVEQILEVKHLVYNESFTLKGAKQRLKELKKERNKQLSGKLEDSVSAKALEHIKDELLLIKNVLLKT
ncbi:MAG: MerR family transcriptional regulator [Nitrospinota bacterium]